MSGGGPMRLIVLSGGAAQGLVEAMAPDLAQACGATVAGTFGAVGAMRDRLLAGEPADLVILTKALIGALEREGAVLAGSARDIGVVRTAVAARRGDPLPLVGTADLLREALREAGEIHVPDMRQSTAGAHVAGVLARLGIAGETAGRLREHPNGMTAMAALAASGAARPIGCTQVTEILATPGVTLVRALPASLELATTYTAAVAARSTEAGLAHRFLALLAGEGTRPRRLAAGFEAA